MKKSTAITMIPLMIVAGLVGGYWASRAGDLEPPAAPAPTMLTLSELSAQIASASGGEAPHRFVAATTALAGGFAGWKGMNDLCVTEFAATHPEIRMCFSEEVLETPVSLWPLFSIVWIHPTIAAVNDTAFVDVSGVSDPSAEHLSCDGWADGNSTGRGLAYSTFIVNKHILTPCNNELAVACCAPTS